MMPNTNTQCAKGTPLTETQCNDYRIASRSTGTTGGFPSYPRGCFAYGTTTPPAIYFNTYAAGKHHSNAKPICITDQCASD